MLQVAISLDQLDRLICEMAGEEEVVPRLDHPSKAHEQCRVHGKS